MKATASMGTMLFQAIQQAPKALQGEDAYTEAIGNTAYIPEDPKALEYMGDFGNMLEKLETEYKIPALMPELMPFQSLANLAVSQAGRGVAQGATRAGMAAERALDKPVFDIMNRGGRGAELLSSFATNPAQVVKEKGGNWLKGTVEGSTAPLKVTHQTDRNYDPAKRLAELKQYTPEFIVDREKIYPTFGQAARNEIQQLEPKAAINNWIEQKLNKYIKNEMGTPEDPIRALAEQGITHLPPNTRLPPNYSSVQTTRREAGFPEEGLAQSDLAKVWEGWADKPIGFATTGEAMNVGKGEPWMEKVDPFTRVHGIAPNWGRHIHSDLGFDHIMDVLKEDLATGRITPDQLSKISMEQAVRRTNEYNQELAKKMAEARNLSRQDLPVLKEYPEGYRWVELNKPGAFASESEAMGHSVRGYEPPKDHPDWSDEAGDSGYPEYGFGGWDAIKSGRAKVYSLVDKKNNPHVTIEVAENENPYSANGSGFVDLPMQTRAQYQEIIRQWRRNNPDVEYLTDADINTALREAGVKPINPPEIHQIKGKQNAEPKPEYLPFVRDFQRTTGNRIEDDFQNSGFDWKATGSRGIFAEDEVASLKDMGYDVPDYLTTDEKEDLVRKLYERETGNNMDTGEPLNLPSEEPPIEGMKRGGRVHISDNPDTMAMELNDRHLAGGGLLRKAAKLAMRDSDAMVTSARGATKFAEPKPKTMSVIKEKGGNWLGGNIAGGVDKRLQSLKSKTAAGSDPADALKQLQEKFTPQEIERIASTNPNLANIRETMPHQMKHLNEQASINNWIERNVGNYVKKEMGTPEDPVRLMLEKRAQEIEAQFQVDMNRAERTRARAEAEEDPRRKANLMRQAGREEEQAKFDRDFANEHATHLPKDEYGPDEDALSDLKSKREMAGFAPEGMAKSEPAQRWENLSDEAVDIQFAKNIQKQQAMAAQSKEANLAYDKIFNEVDERYSVEFRKELEDRGVTLDDQQFMNIIRSTPITDKADFLGLGDEFKKLRQESFNADRMFSSGLQEIGEENPFVSKLDPETNLYSAYLGDLGIDHVVDVIKQDVAAGRIRPDQLNKLSMDQAIKRTAEFNMEQAKKMRETAIKNTEGFPVHKEYPEEGYKWIELTVPKKDLPSGWSVKEALNPMSGKQFQVFDESGAPIAGAYGKTEESAISSATKQLGRPELETALKYEGDTMGHCVGGYCPDVVAGKSRIYSLRDSRGEPHVTVEVNPTRKSAMSPQEFYNSKNAPPSLLEKINEAEKAGDLNDIGSVDLLVQYSPEYQAYLESMPVTQSIRQIKGKGNARPIEKYDPYTQDFVRSGEWSDVGDLKNTGLVRQDGKYMTQSEYDDYLLNQLQPPEGEGMKAGGKVHISDNPDSMMLEMEDQKFQVGGIVDVAARAAKAAKAAQMKKAMKASEALAQIEGKRLNVTQADRTKVGQGYLGGPGFSGLQLQEGPHKDVGAVWGVKNTGTAKTIIGGFDKPLGKEYFTTMIGSPTQHQSNQMVFDKLYGDFKKEAKKGNLDPELKDKINARLAAAVDKDGNPIFPPDVDILDKDFKKIVNTFDRRAVTGNLLGGVGVGGKKGQIIDYDKVIRDTTDPFLLDAPSGSMGYRLWTPSGEIIERPDLHPAFPAILTGEDLGVEFSPAAQDILMAPWVENVRQTKGRNPGYMDWTRGRPPSVEVTEDILTNLQKSGNKKGGLIKVKRKAGGGMISKAAKEALERMKPAKAEMAAKGALWDKKAAEDASKYTRDIDPFNPSMEDIQAEIQRMQSKQDVRKAIGGAVYNTNPDMRDGGQIIQGDAFKRGGTVRDKFKRK
jgi:hypothetical protein